MGKVCQGVHCAVNVYYIAGLCVEILAYIISNNTV